MRTLTVDNFFSVDYANYASYDNYRKVANYIDGFKPSARKVIHTLIKHNFQHPIKVESLQSKTVDECQYVHGAQNLYGVIVGLAQDIVGINNLPLLTRDGNFGNRLEFEASASRYIKTNKIKELGQIIRAEDNCVLVEQVFEGAVIEPRFYLPVLPMILVNGSRGITQGFAQLVLPRNPVEIKKHLICKLTNKKSSADLKPWFNGFCGNITESANGFEIRGIIERVNTNVIRINELPINYSLKKYCAVLNELEDSGFIVSYRDLSNDNKFCFEVRFTRETLSGLTNDDLFKKLRLEQKVTENLTCSDENLAIVNFSNIDELFDRYIGVRFSFLEKRKLIIVSDYEKELRLYAAQIKFITLIINDKVIINKKTMDEINAQLAPFDDIYKVNGGYDYLLNMTLKNLTVEKIKELEEKIVVLREKIMNLNKKTVQEIWLDELNELSLIGKQEKKPAVSVDVKQNKKLEQLTLL